LLWRDGLGKNSECSGTKTEKSREDCFHRGTAAQTRG
jgi:hypothetical protein